MDSQIPATLITSTSSVEAKKDDKTAKSKKERKNEKLIITKGNEEAVQKKLAMVSVTV